MVNTVTDWHAGVWAQYRPASRGSSKAQWPGMRDGPQSMFGEATPIAGWVSKEMNLTKLRGRMGKPPTTCTQQVSAAAKLHHAPCPVPRAGLTLG